MINPDVRHIIEPELRSGEKLLWADKPAKFPLSFMMIYILGFSIVWTLFAIGFFGAVVFGSFFDANVGETSNDAVEAGAIRIGFSIFSFLFVVIGVGMIVQGLKMLISPSKEIYALTNQRGIIISPFFKYRIASLSPENLKNLERKGDPELGTLTFASKGNGMMGMKPYQTELNAFLKIKNPKQVEDLIYITFEASS